MKKSQENCSSSVFTFVNWTLHFFLIDFLMLGVVLPIGAAHVLSRLAQLLDVGITGEVWTLMFGIFLAFMFTFYTNIEAPFWRRLFFGGKGFVMLLKLRDLSNVVLLLFYTHHLVNTIVLISRSGQMKQAFLGEGIGFVFFNSLMDAGVPIPNFIKAHFTWTPSAPQSFWNWGMKAVSFSDEKARMVHYINAANLMIAIAGIVGTVTKALYFNSLHSYIRSMRVYTKLQDESPPRTREQSIFDVAADYLAQPIVNSAKAKLLDEED